MRNLICVEETFPNCKNAVKIDQLKLNILLLWLTIMTTGLIEKLLHERIHHFTMYT